VVQLFVSATYWPHFRVSGGYISTKHRHCLNFYARHDFQWRKIYDILTVFEKKDKAM